MIKFVIIRIFDQVFKLHVIPNINTRFFNRIRNDLYAHMLTLGPSFFGHMPVGDIISRTTNDITAVRLLGGPGVLNVANTVIVYVVSVGPMLMLSPKLTLMALSPMVLLFSAARIVGPQIYKRSFAAQEELAALTSIANESITGIEVVHSYGLEGLRSDRFEQGSDRYRNAYLRFVLYRSVLLPIMVGMGGIGTLVVLYFGGSGVIDGSLTLGDFVAFGRPLSSNTAPGRCLSLANSAKGSEE